MNKRIYKIICDRGYKIKMEKPRGVFRVPPSQIFLGQSSLPDFRNDENKTDRQTRDKDLFKFESYFFSRERGEGVKEGVFLQRMVFVSP